MKKLCLLFILVASVSVLQFCSSSKKMAAASKVTYMHNIQPVVLTSCSPCHFPPKGNKKPLDTYAGVKNNIDTILARIQMNPDQRGFMPARHPKMSDSTIMVFKQWQADGLLEN